jgi:ubiquinone/menaquinone biosynthesis C-methylase UbiE
MAAIVNHQPGLNRSGKEDQIWANAKSSAWADSITSGKSVFTELYEDTRTMVMRHLAKNDYDCVIDICCGTGEIAGELDVDLPMFGVDINPNFIETAQKIYGSTKVQWEVGNAMEFSSWWMNKQRQIGKTFTKPLVICCNNSIQYIPDTNEAYRQMKMVAGTQGKCLATFWNGNFFPCGVKDYYMKNESLCGKFELCAPFIDFEKRTLMTKTGYTSRWPRAEEIQKECANYGVHLTHVPPQSICDLKSNEILPEMDYIQEMVMGIAIVYSGMSDPSTRPVLM